MTEPVEPPNELDVYYCHACGRLSLLPDGGMCPLCLSPDRTLAYPYRRRRPIPVTFRLLRDGEKPVTGEIVEQEPRRKMIDELEEEMTRLEEAVRPYMPEIFPDKP